MPHSPRVPSPADLARARPRPVPPPAPPSRGRRLADLDKDRAQRALRAAVANPSTDFAAMSPDDFFAALRCACQDGTTNPALIADARRRLDAGLAASRDLHQVILAAGTRDAWAEARAAALAVVARQPHLAVEIIALETQRLTLPSMRVTESAGDGQFTAQASLERAGTRVEGSPQTDGSKKRARQGAALSLLAEVAGLALPSAPPALALPGAGVPAPRPGAGAPPGRAGGTAAAISPAELEAWLDYEVSRPTPDPALAAAVSARNLTVRSVFLLLFEAAPDGWARQREQAWDAFVANPSQAPGVLSMVTQSRSVAPALYAQPDERTALAYVAMPDGLVVGEPAVATSAKAARAAAAFALVRDLAPPVARETTATAPAPGANPVGTLNERAQTGTITDLTYTHEMQGPAHQPVFTCTASCVFATDLLSTVVEGRSKNEAKAGAAASLLEQVIAAEHARLARLARAHRAQARNPEGIVTRLLRAGYPLGFDGTVFRVGGDLPDALAGWTLPLLPALRVLVGLEEPVDGSARAWAAAAREALRAVAARQVYPALDARGLDCWRLAPEASDPSVAAFRDAVADLLLRPPGARLAVGDLPYAGESRALGSEAAAWADRAAQAAEARPAAPLVIRVSPPDDDGLPLRAELRATGRDALGHAEHRLLRRAAAVWPPITRVARDGVVEGSDASDLLGGVGDQLAELGITSAWPSGLVAASGLAAQAVVTPRSPGGAGAFSLTDDAALSWRLSLDGDPLTDEETAAVAAAVAGVLRLRGRWVVVDAETRARAGTRDAGRLTGAQALGAALTGQVSIGGREVGCAGAGRLAELVEALRGAGQSTGEQVPDPGGLHAALRAYQRRAVGWLTRTTSLGFGALLADDMGLGKTLTVIAFRLAREAAGPTLVVCPASLLANWEREFARFAPSVTVRRYHGAGRTLDGLADGEVVVTTYGTQLRDAAALAAVPWDLVVTDEAQQVKNHRSQSARALRELRPSARVAVTGTPVENSLSELWAILDWTNPGLFGTLAAFRDRYGRAAEREAAGADPDRAAARRLGRLIAPFVLRRRKTDPDVAPELPDKVVSDRYVQLTREQSALYQAATTEVLGRIASSSGIERRGQVLRMLQSLRQICNSPAHFLRESPHSWDADAQAARSGKLQALEELMEALVLADEAALVFTGYVSMGHLLRAHLAARGIRAEFLHGAVPVAARQQIVDRFQAGEGDALILSVRAAGTGLNLTRAGHVIHFDRPWNPAVEDQATDRAHRLGQHRLVEVHHLIAEGTVEDRIAALLARKRELTEAVLASGETALTELSDSELSALVSLGTDLSAGGTP